jgi:hypothetical protein
MRGSRNKPPFRIAFEGLPGVYKSEWRDRMAAIYLGYDF